MNLHAFFYPSLAIGAVITLGSLSARGDKPKCTALPEGKIPPAFKALLGKGDCPPGEIDSAALSNVTANKGSSPEREEWRRNRAESRRDFHPHIAKRVAYRANAKPPFATNIRLGDGWGCAQLHDASQHCWEVTGRDTKRGNTIKAQHIPWLDDHWIGVGPDRVCQQEDVGVRCWRAPEFMHTPQVWEAPGSLNASRELTWRVEKSELVDPTPVTHGAWHGCSSDLCWSPDKAPTALKMCRAGRISIPCAIATQVAVDQFKRNTSSGSPIVGDLFACVRWSKGLQCIGASRDGFFGTTEECPTELLKAWPTSAGPVAAPNAKCSRRPVRVGSREYMGNEASASSRGVCLEDDSNPGRADFDCFGPIGAPDKSMYPVVMGLGDEPSACGINKLGQVYCWGAGYTAAISSIAAVRIEFEIPKSGSTVAWQGKGPFRSTCDINRNCTKATATLPACSQGETGMSVAAVLDRADALEGQLVTLRGTLGISKIDSNQAGISCCPDGTTDCSSDKATESGDYCCDEAEGPIAIVGGRDYLTLEGLKCGGDLSQMCCNLPVLGQSVLTSGLLTWRDFVLGAGPSWVLAHPRICEIRPKRPTQPPTPATATGITR
jgi:hypothetical protein